jgi:hypothetical protein
MIYETWYKGRAVTRFINSTSSGYNKPVSPEEALSVQPPEHRILNHYTSCPSKHTGISPSTLSRYNTVSRRKNSIDGNDPNSTHSGVYNVGCLFSRVG